MKLHLNDRIVSAFFLEFVLNVLQHQADHLDDRDDQRAKSQGARVVPGCVMTFVSSVDPHLIVLPMLVNTGRAGTSDFLRVQYLKTNS